MSEYKTIPVIKRTVPQERQRLPTQQYNNAQGGYVRPKQTVTDTIQNKEAIEKKLEGYVEISSAELDQIVIGSHVRYISMDPNTNRPLFRVGGHIQGVYKEYVILKGANNTRFSAQRVIKDGNGNVVFNTRFFKKIKQQIPQQPQQQQQQQQQQTSNNQDELLARYEKALAAKDNEIEELKQMMNKMMKKMKKMKQ